MALKGQKRRFAQAIIAAKPLKISNKEAALLIGCKENSASASGSRCAADAEVRAYILAHWPDYYDVKTVAETVTQQDELPFFCASSVAEWLITAHETDVQAVAKVLETRLGIGDAELDEGVLKRWLGNVAVDDVRFKALVQAVCAKLAVSVNPVDYWDSVLMNPYATAKEKAQAASDKAKFTIAKPASQNRKEAALEKAQILREQRRQGNAMGDFFGDESEKEQEGSKKMYKGFVPLWN